MMKNTLSVLLISGLVLGGCGSVRSSKLNPFNWFGGAKEERVESDEPINPLIPERKIFDEKEYVYPGTAIEKITTLRVERTAEGAIVRVAGVATLQGDWDARLIPDLKDETPVKGVLTYHFRTIKSPYLEYKNTEATRVVTAAHVVTDQQLAGVRTIRVIAETNAMSVRR